MLRFVLITRTKCKGMAEYTVSPPKYSMPPTLGTKQKPLGRFEIYLLQSLFNVHRKVS